MITRRVLIVTVVCWFATLVALIWVFRSTNLDPGEVVFDLRSMTIFLGPLALLNLGLAAFGGLRRSRYLTWAASLACLLQGAMAAAYVELNVLEVSRMVELLSPPDPLPRHAESLLVMLVGLTGPILGLGLLKIRGG